MSTTATTPSSAGAAPWKSLFLAHLSKMPSPEFVLSSLAPSSSSSSSSSSSTTSHHHPSTPYVPRARYCIYRGMWCSLPPNKHLSKEQERALNPANVYESDMLTFTTDARMQKVPEIFASSAGHGAPAQSHGSGGGGPVEAVFWIKDAGAQWRFKGHAYVIGPDIEGDEGGEEEGESSGSSSSGVRTVKSRVGEGMRVINEEGKAHWSWRRELSAHFANLTPWMRGSFKNPPPGTPISSSSSSSGARGDPSPKDGERLAQLVEVPLDEDELARANFRVVVIRAHEVEQLDTGEEPEKARRWRYTYVGPREEEEEEEERGGGGGEFGEWKKEELWP